MQFWTLITAATFFFLISASPVEIVPRQFGDIFACGLNQQASCCQQIQNQETQVNNSDNTGVTGPISIPITIALNCIGVNICNINQKQYCCNNKITGVSGISNANGFHCS